MEQLLAAIIKEFYVNRGIKHNENVDVTLLLQRFFSFRLKYISIQKRKLKVSKELSLKLSDHPSKDHCFALFEKNAIGADLNPHQSKNVANADKHDYLYNDWGLHHLHLSNLIKGGEYFVDRADYLLFAKFTDTTTYFIDILKHKEQNVWSQKKLIKIIHDNWPDIIAGGKIGIQSPNLNDEEIGILRRKGYSFGINIDEKTAYLLIGDGYAVSGDNLAAGLMADNVRRWMWQSQTLYDVDIKQFEKELRLQMQLD